MQLFDAEVYVEEKLRQEDLGFSRDILVIVEFILEFPDQVSRAPKASIDSEEYWDKVISRVLKGRTIRPFAQPRTMPDPVVSLILNRAYGIDQSKLEQVKKEHQLSMVAENVVGEMLERYISKVVGVKGWVWASGEIIKSVDFIRKDADDWDLLQVKNRDNSENSSSAAIRKGTTIKKWHRSKSLTGKTLWESFPVDTGGTEMSEDGFQEFVVDYIVENFPKP